MVKKAVPTIIASKSGALGKIAEIEKRLPTPPTPDDPILKIFRNAPLIDLDTLPDKGKEGIGKMLNIATAIAAHTAYSLGKARAMYAIDKSKDNRAMVEYWNGLDVAYQRILNAISREISLRRDSFEREKTGERHVRKGGF